MNRGPFRWVLLLGIAALAAGCASSGGGVSAGGAYAGPECSDPSVVSDDYGYSYPAYYDLVDNPCVAYPVHDYYTPTPETARNVVSGSEPRPHTTTVERPASPLWGNSFLGDYGTANNTYSPNTVNQAPVMPTSSSPTTTTVAPRPH